VTDGPWDAHDAEAVRDAQGDAEARALSRRERGELLRRRVVLAASETELADMAVAAGQPRFRGKQLRQAVLGGAATIQDISTIPKSWREQLTQEGWRTGRSHLHHEVRAADGTAKYLLQLSDGLVVETVGIPSDADGGGRLTCCVSSQVGCPMRCTFCATGKGGFARNLEAHEVVDQVLTVQERFGQRVSNAVFMGMGEPLLNVPAVLDAVRVLNEEVGIGARKITISTVGVPNAIARLAQERLQCTLAVSIHAPSQALRERIAPSARAYPIDALMADCSEYFRATGRRVSFEYTLLAGVNDQPQHAAELSTLLRKARFGHGGAFHVNLIPWNPVDESEFKRPVPGAVAAFEGLLKRDGVPVSVRETRGLEAAVACGQLRNAHQKQALPATIIQPLG